MKYIKTSVLVIVLIIFGYTDVSQGICSSYPNSICYKSGLYHNDTPVYPRNENIEELEKDINILRALIRVSFEDKMDRMVINEYCLEFFTTLACLYLYTPCRYNMPLRFCEDTCFLDKFRVCSVIIDKLTVGLKMVENSIFDSYIFPHNCTVLLDNNINSTECFSISTPLDNNDGIEIINNNNDEITRIISSTTEGNNGTVQISVTKLGIWGDICITEDTNQTQLKNIGNVICRSLDYPHLSAEVTTSMPDNTSSLYMMSDVRCIGNESTILDCSFKNISFKYCEPNRRLYVKCRPEDHIECGKTYSLCSTTSVSTTQSPEIRYSLYYFILIPLVLIIFALLMMIIISVLILRYRIRSRVRVKRNQQFISNTRSSTSEHYSFGLKANTVPRPPRPNLQLLNKEAVMHIPGYGGEEIEIYSIATPSAHNNNFTFPDDMARGTAYLKEYCGDDIVEFIIPNTRLVLIESIGEGAFGVVWKATISERGEDEINTVECHEFVAAKTLKDAKNERELKDILIECALLKDLKHENILGLLAVTMIGSQPYIITPYMKFGDIKNHLREIRKEAISNNVLPHGLTEDMLIKMSLDVASGMEFLSNKRYVHRDLAARNCMMDHNMTVKVSDFGLSREIYISDYYRHKGGKVPAKWMAPESLTDGVFDEKTDIWAYGVTLWEIFSLGRNPYPGIGNENVLSFLEKGKRLSKPVICPKEMYDFMHFCWQSKPKDRPTFKVVCSYIKSLNYFNVHESNPIMSAKRRKFTCKEIYDEENAVLRVESQKKPNKLKRQTVIEDDSESVPFEDAQNVNIENLCLNLKNNKHFLTVLGESQLSNSFDSSLDERYIIPHMSISIPILNATQRERTKSLRYTKKKLTLQERPRPKTTSAIVGFEEISSPKSYKGIEEKVKKKFGFRKQKSSEKF